MASKPGPDWGGVDDIMVVVEWLSFRPAAKRLLCGTKPSEGVATNRSARSVALIVIDNGDASRGNTSALGFDSHVTSASPRRSTLVLLNALWPCHKDVSRGLAHVFLAALFRRFSKAFWALARAHARPQRKGPV